VNLNFFYKLDLRHSTDGLYANSNSTWDIPKTYNDENKSVEQVIFEKPDQIRQLLAEATGEEPIINTAASITPASAEIISNCDQSVEERLRNIFHLPVNEILKGEWPCYIVQSAIVPGFMYLTSNYICFYASLPKGQVKYGVMMG
jgi:hypothetical protein